MRSRLLVTALALVPLAGIGAYSMRPAPVPPADFSDTLRGPGSPNLSIPFGAYALTPEGLLRADSSSGQVYGLDRPMVRTRSGAYLSRDFVFEVDVTIPSGAEDIAFAGFGLGDPNPRLSNEPGAAFIFRIHSLPGMDVVHTAAAPPPGGRPSETVTPTDVPLRLAEVGRYEAGRQTTFRIERAGDLVTLSMPGTPDARSAFDLRDYPKLFGGGSGFLFFGNSAEGTIFSNVRVRPRG